MFGLLIRNLWMIAYCSYAIPCIRVLISNNGIHHMVKFLSRDLPCQWSQGNQRTRHRRQLCCALSKISWILVSESTQSTTQGLYKIKFNDWLYHYSNIFTSKKQVSLNKIKLAWYLVTMALARNILHQFVLIILPIYQVIERPNFFMVVYDSK